MRRSLLALSLLPVLSFAPACDTGDDDATSDQAFRTGTDVNMQLTESGEGGDNGTVIWDIQEAGVYAGEASEGNQIMELVGNEIYANGELTCTVENAYLNGRVVMGAGDEVLFTVYENEVYLGEIDAKRLGPKTKRRFADQLLLTFDGSDVHWGHYDGEFLSANADLESASDGRKLLIAALVEGHCGSKGLP